MTKIAGKTLAQWQDSHPLLTPLIATQPLLWLNPQRQRWSAAKPLLPLDESDIHAAAERLQRFAPFIAKVFPDTAPAQGMIESPVQAVPMFQTALNTRYQSTLVGQMWMKCDSHLPISGSIKARGGIYEVLKVAEQVALDAGLINTHDNYQRFADEDVRALLSRHQIVVGSTGNLGLSIGIMGAALGFRVTVHMSADARAWKKALLRSKGVEVIEYEADYSKAVEAGREQAMQQARCHFVDDENSQDLFLGYSVAAQRLQSQLKAQGIEVDEAHPLFVYLPCGVGGGPGGVAFGLKQVFGDAVHCFFAEPTHSPCMLLGMYTGLHQEISVQDIGIDNQTCADGLAVGRASGFVGKVMEPLLSGVFTVNDDELYALLALLSDREGLQLEPSALAGVPGIAQVLASDYLQQAGLEDCRAAITHLVWATGGSMVPADEWQQYYTTGKELL